MVGGPHLETEYGVGVPSLLKDKRLEALYSHDGVTFL